MCVERPVSPAGEGGLMEKEKGLIPVGVDADVILHHPFCRNSECSVCLEDHEALQHRLSVLPGDVKKYDHLGKYRYFLDLAYPD